MLRILDPGSSTRQPAQVWTGDFLPLSCHAQQLLVEREENLRGRTVCTIPEIYVSHFLALI
jgi:hypothetical protein